jgi:hypothetical protein
MTRPIDPLFDPRLADWLEEDESTAPEQALETVLTSFPSIKQRRALRVPWRTTSMSSTLRLGLAAAVVVAATLGGIYFLGLRPSSSVAGPESPTPSLADSPMVSASPRAEPSASAEMTAAPPAGTPPPVGEITFGLPYHDCGHLPSVDAHVAMELGPTFRLKAFDGERLVADAYVTRVGVADGGFSYDVPVDVDRDGLVTVSFGVVRGVFPQRAEDTRLDVELSQLGQLVARGVFECVPLSP